MKIQYDYKNFASLVGVKKRQLKRITLTILSGFSVVTLVRRIGGQKLFHKVNISFL